MMFVALKNLRMLLSILHRPFFQCNDVILEDDPWKRSKGRVNIIFQFSGLGRYPADNNDNFHTDNWNTDDVLHLLFLGKSAFVRENVRSGCSGKSILLIIQYTFIDIPPSLTNTFRLGIHGRHHLHNQPSSPTEPKPRSTAAAASLKFRSRWFCLKQSPFLSLFVCVNT